MENKALLQEAGVLKVAVHWFNLTFAQSGAFATSSAVA